LITRQSFETPPENASTTPKVPSNALLNKLAVPITEPFINPESPSYLRGIFLKSLSPSLTVETNFLGFPKIENEKKSLKIFFFNEYQK
jgi:hypothetical protein